MYDPIKDIENSTDIKFLQELLDKWIPMDIKNIEEGDHSISAKLNGISEEELKKRRLKGMRFIKSKVEERIKQLKK